MVFRTMMAVLSKCALCNRCKSIYQLHKVKGHVKRMEATYLVA